MSTPDQLRSAEDILAVCRLFGRSVTPIQFESWRKRGLIPTPIRRFGGQGTGSETLGYPDRAVLNVVAVASALRHKRSLDQATLWMWLAGFDVTEAAYRMLRRKAARWSETLQRELRAESDAADADNPGVGSDLLNRLVYHRAPKWASPFRRYFRGEYRDQFHTAAYLVMKALDGQGGVTDWGSKLGPDEDETEPLRRALGVAPHPDEKPAQSREWREGLANELKKLEREFSPGALVGELEAIRELEEWSDLLEDLRNQFSLWVIGMTMQFGGPFVPVTPGGFLLWFAARYVSVRGSRFTFFLLQPWLMSEHRGEFLKSYHLLVQAFFLFPKVEEIDERARQLLRA